MICSFLRVILERMEVVSLKDMGWAMLEALSYLTGINSSLAYSALFCLQWYDTLAWHFPRLGNVIS